MSRYPCKNMASSFSYLKLVGRQAQLEHGLKSAAPSFSALSPGAWSQPELGDLKERL